MELKNIKLKKGMEKEEVNELIGEWIELADDVYLGSEYKHDWKCKCGNTISSRIYYNIRKFKSIKCLICAKPKKVINENVKQVKIAPGMKAIDINKELSKNGINLIFNDTKLEYINNKQKHTWICECGRSFVRNWSDIKNQNRLYCGKCNEKDFYSRINEVALRKGMKNVQVNKLIIKWIEFLDDEYVCNKHNHNWRCKCGNEFFREWGNIRSKQMLKCEKCLKNNIIKKQMREVEKNGKYKYIKAYFVGDNLPSGAVVDRYAKLEIKHVYCGNKMIVTSGSKLDMESCSKCCGSYEKSFAHYIEVELGEPLEKYWDYEKNKVNPYHISVSSKKKVYIKCRTCEEMYKNTADQFTRRSRVSSVLLCRKCNISMGETKLKELLSLNGVNYIHDKPYFKDLLSDKGNPLRPDFILPEHKIWIEYDGEFHYNPITGEDRLRKQQYHDKLKDEYAEKHGWKMIRIPYWDFDNIENILNIELINSNKLI